MARLTVPFILLFVALQGCGRPSGGGETSEATTAETTGGDVCEEPTALSSCPDASVDYCACSEGRRCPTDESWHQIWAGLNCTECHSDNGTTPEAGLSLDVEDARLNLVNFNSNGPNQMARVVPGQPAESYLWHKIRLAHTCVDGAMGDGMPPNSVLTIEQLREIETWICCGANI